MVTFGLSEAKAGATMAALALRGVCMADIHKACAGGTWGDAIPTDLGRPPPALELAQRRSPLSCVVVASSFFFFPISRFSRMDRT